MKNYTLLLFVLLSCAYLQAQEQKTILQSPPKTATAPAAQPLKQVSAAPSSSSSISLSATPAKDSLEGETIAHCDAVITAIDHKVGDVKNDPARDAKATADGWYEKMARNRALYVARKETLLQRAADH